MWVTDRLYRMREARLNRERIRIQCDPAAQDKTKAKRLLYIVYYDPQGLGTIRQTVEELIALSGYTVDLLNLYPDISIFSGVEMDAYDGVILHNTITYSPDALGTLNRVGRRGGFMGYRGLKVMMKQDEHYRIGEIARFIGENGFHLLLHVSGVEIRHLLYPRDLVGNVQFMQFLTDYVPDTLHTRRYDPVAGRTVDVGYRGSIQPVTFGRLSYEKRSIGADFEPCARARGLVTDISSRWEDRYMGGAWLDFLGRCKGVLGVESGSDIVDYYGGIEKACDALRRQRPDLTDEALLDILAPFEVTPYRGISPRHFEAAACCAAQLMFEDGYQGIFKPDIHYIPLKRDFSNADEAIDRLLDDAERRRMTERAFEDIILNPEYAFGTFVKRLDERLDGLFAGR